MITAINSNILKNALKADIELDVQVIESMATIDSIQVSGCDPEFTDFDFFTKEIEIDNKITEYLSFPNTHLNDLKLGSIAY
ncbi:hypothetical protein [Photobacterium sp. GB-72]|uniref:hypothetical protein n=1 Tax=Photobacterium sp. GB-72 TaxID=2022105 RepID=UPI000D16637C|nr:hypothetical protein [Photobacterium sp. GB-72]PSV25931.1 hypothetical protein C9J40_21670 [Photobacterium sp. GB-72]PSV25932.1 hypothetical protein C9J40_21675 [Photobacterium sp. GB-72]